MAEQTEREYYLSQIPQEFHKAVENIAYDHAHHCGEEEIVRTIGDIVDHLAPCFEFYRDNLLYGLDDRKFD